ncbi:MULTISPECIES: hypothetical protein [Bradyrhizobium]|nr:hypothetical protein [Bradyrhizobium vignae]
MKKPPQGAFLLTQLAVIPGRAKARTMVRDCAPENLEIPGSVLRTAPE